MSSFYKTVGKSTTYDMKPIGVELQQTQGLVSPKNDVDSELVRVESDNVKDLRHSFKNTKNQDLAYENTHIETKDFRANRSLPKLSKKQLVHPTTKVEHHRNSVTTAESKVKYLSIKSFELKYNPQKKEKPFSNKKIAHLIEHSMGNTNSKNLSFHLPKDTGIRNVNRDAISPPKYTESEFTK